MLFQQSHCVSRSSFWPIYQLISAYQLMGSCSQVEEFHMYSKNTLQWNSYLCYVNMKPVSSQNIAYLTRSGFNNLRAQGKPRHLVFWYKTIWETQCRLYDYVLELPLNNILTVALYYIHFIFKSNIVSVQNGCHFLFGNVKDFPAGPLILIGWWAAVYCLVLPKWESIQHNRKSI